jgi:hypothetical protein
MWYVISTHTPGGVCRPGRFDPPRRLLCALGHSASGITLPSIAKIVNAPRKSRNNWREFAHTGKKQKLQPKLPFHPGIHRWRTITRITPLHEIRLALGRAGGE